MKKTVWLAGFLVVSMVMVAGCAGKVGGSPDFSANLVSRVGGRTQNGSGKIYFSKDKWRMDITAYGQKSISIVRADKNVMWLLMPKEKMYMERKLEPDQLVGMSKKLPGEVERKKVGSEKVSGLACDKYKITYKLTGGKATDVVYQWISKDGIPVKSAAPDGSWYTMYRNIKVGKQPASLFELPAGYTKFEMPSY